MLEHFHSMLFQMLLILMTLKLMKKLDRMLWIMVCYMTNSYIYPRVFVLSLVIEVTKSLLMLRFPALCHPSLRP